MSELKSCASSFLELNKGVGDFKNGSAPLQNCPVWNLLKEEVSLPAAVIDLDRLEHNLEWMQNFVNLYKFELSPHGKTSMSPALFKRQISHGAWGITLATASQTKVAANFGMKRVLLANQLVGLQNMGIIAEIQGSDPEFDFMCLLDSADNAKALGEFFAKKNQVLKVMLEYGVGGGRAGIRGDEQEDAVLEEIRRWASLRLVGVEFYEGIAKTEKEVREFIRRVVSRFLILLERSAFGVETALISGSGSCWYDVVAEELSFLQDLPLNSPTISHYQIKVVLRPGCYVTHGLRMYEEIDRRLIHKNPLDGNGLQHSLSVWAYVQSKPEENSVIIGMGKREVLDDCGLPVPYYHFRPHGGAGNDWKPKDVSCRGWKLLKLMDQHAFMQVDADSFKGIGIGDIVIFLVCHPCTTFDKWKCILGVDAEFNVKEIFQTYF